METIWEAEEEYMYEMVFKKDKEEGEEEQDQE